MFGGKSSEVALFTTMFLLSVWLKIIEWHMIWPIDSFALYIDILLHSERNILQTNFQFFFLLLLFY